MTNIAAFLDAAAAQDPDRPALILDDATVWGYGALHREVGRWAATTQIIEMAAHGAASAIDLPTALGHQHHCRVQ